MDLLLDIGTDLLGFIWSAVIWGFLVKYVAMKYLATWVGKKIEQKYTSQRKRFPLFLAHFREKHSRDIDQCGINHCAKL